MKRVTIDFSECKYYLEIYSLIREKLDLPEWFGCNLDALWDCLTGGFIERITEVHLKGMDKVPKNLQSGMQKIVEIFKEADEDEMGDIKLIL